MQSRWLCLQGVLCPEDAHMGVEAGADGIIVSNHGGRQLDYAPAALDALPGIAAAVGKRVPVLMDGGVRRGTDIIKVGSCCLHFQCNMSLASCDIAPSYRPAEQTLCLAQI